MLDSLPQNLNDLPLITSAQRAALPSPTTNVQVVVFDTLNPLARPSRMSTAEFIKFPAGLTVDGSSVTALGIATSTSANALAIGPAGATNPSINVDASTASAATGFNIKSAAAGGGLAVKVISSGTNESLTIDAKGSGTIALNATGTGNVTTPRPVIITSAEAQSFAVGRQGATTPSLEVDSSTASQAAGVKITGLATTAGATIAPLGSTNEPLFIDGKGSGPLHLGSVSTGGVKIGTSGEASAIKGMYQSGNVAVTIPTIADAEISEVAVDVSGAFTMQPAIGDQVLVNPSEALPTDCILCGAYVSATDQVTISFAAKEGGSGVTGAAKNFKMLVIDMT